MLSSILLKIRDLLTPRAILEIKAEIDTVDSDIETTKNALYAANLNGDEVEVKKQQAILGKQREIRGHQRSRLILMKQRRSLKRSIKSREKYGMPVPNMSANTKSPSKGMRKEEEYKSGKDRSIEDLIEDAEAEIRRLRQG